MGQDCCLQKIVSANLDRDTLTRRPSDHKSASYLRALLYVFYFVCRLVTAASRAWRLGRGTFLFNAPSLSLNTDALRYQCHLPCLDKRTSIPEGVEDSLKVAPWWCVLARFIRLNVVDPYNLTLPRIWEAMSHTAGLSRYRRRPAAFLPPPPAFLARIFCSSGSSSSSSSSSSCSRF